MVKKVIFADLDGTLIKTASGETFPKGIWDMKIRYDVLEAIKRCNVERLAVVSNQAGIAAGYVIKRNFDAKAGYLRAAFEEYLGINVDFIYCDSADKNNENRKPNVGMLEACRKSFIAVNKFYTKEKMLMIGDASGKPGQFGDSDFKTAENFGIDYLDVEDFVDIYGKKDSEELSDLEKEFESFLDNIEGVPRMWHSDEQIEWAKDIAKHFFELGIAVSSKEQKV